MPEVIHRVGGIAIDHPTECAVDLLAGDLVDRFNTTHPDTVLLVARAFTGCHAATEARLLTLDRTGIDLVVTDRGRAHYHRVDYPTRIDSPEGICAALCDLVRLARAHRPHGAPTTFERLMKAVTPRRR